MLSNQKEVSQKKVEVEKIQYLLVSKKNQEMFLNKFLKKNQNHNLKEKDQNPSKNLKVMIKKKKL